MYICCLVSELTLLRSGPPKATFLASSIVSHTRALPHANCRALWICKLMYMYIKCTMYMYMYKCIYQMVNSTEHTHAHACHSSNLHEHVRCKILLLLFKILVEMLYFGYTVYIVYHITLHCILIIVRDGKKNLQFAMFRLSHLKSIQVQCTMYIVYINVQAGVQYTCTQKIVCRPGIGWAMGIVSVCVCVCFASFLGLFSSFYSVLCM